MTAIELQAIAGATIPLVNSKYTADGAASLLTDGTTNAVQYLTNFPYLGHPYQGYLGDTPQALQNQKLKARTRAPLLLWPLLGAIASWISRGRHVVSGAVEGREG